MFITLTLNARRRIACILVALSVVLPTAGASLPFADLADVRGHYDGTGANGEALYVCLLGKAGDLPVCAYWSSGRKERSALFGTGWCVPALESRFVPLDERRWAFHQPDGYVRIFKAKARGNGKPKTLEGGSAWTASVSGDSARIVADPGDGGVKSEFSFRQGRLVHMVCEEGDFVVKYSGRAASAILSRGRPVLEIVRERLPPHRTGICFNGGREQVWTTCRQVGLFEVHEDSAAAVSVQANRLAELEWSDGRKTAFEYGGDGEEAFFSAGGSRWTWNPSTRKILSHGKWTYAIEPPKQEWNEPAFERCDKDGREEFYHNDRQTGLRTERFADGSRRVCKVFTSGPLAWRRVRWQEETDAEGDRTKTDFAYDEEGRMVYRRVTRDCNDEVLETWFGPDGAVLRRRVNGKEDSSG